MNKQIEELKKDISYELGISYEEERLSFSLKTRDYLSKSLIEKGWQKVDKDKQVVLTREEYDNLKLEIQKAHHKGVRVGFDLTKYKENSIEQARKETAREIFKALYSMRDVYAEHYEYEIRLNEYNLQELAKQYGVDLGEEQ